MGKQSRKKEERERIPESQTELLRVGRDMYNNNIDTANFNPYKRYWGLKRN